MLSSHASIKKGIIKVAAYETGTGWERDMVPWNHGLSVLIIYANEVEGKSST